MLNKYARSCRSIVLLALVIVLSVIPSVSPALAAQTTVSPRVMTAPFDEQFIDMMAPHHQGAVAMALIATTRGQHLQIRRLAQAIIGAQNKEIGQMQAWRKAWYGSATTPDMAHMPMLPHMDMRTDLMTSKKMMEDLGKLKTARPFDKAFMAAMLPHHATAIAAAKLELQYGAHAALKAMALGIIESQARETGLMTAYLDLWNGSASSSHMAM